MKPLDEKSPLPWKTILAPTDFSEPSKQAVKTGAYLAEQCGARITLLHVVQLPVSCPIEAALDVDEVMSSGRESLEAMAGEIAPGLIQNKLIRLGPQGVIQAIIDAARELSVDLIVIATHGHRQLERVLLGSTSEKVVRHAPCPVLVVRRKENPPGPNPKKEMNYERIELVSNPNGLGRH
jgi:nucleotide-binding universal stress UspA family protein